MSERDDSIVVARRLVQGLRSLQLASVSADAVPEASYAPFVVHRGAAHVYVSRLATHAMNLLATRVASVLFIEDEKDTQELFARLRFTLHCRIEEINRETAEWHRVMDRFRARFGETVELIRPLHDFHLLRLDAREGRLVEGFARTCTFDQNALEAVFAPQGSDSS